MSAQQEVRGGQFAPGAPARPSGFAGTRAWAVVLALSLAVSFTLALSLVWVNTQRAALAYDLKRMHQDYAELQSYSAKLKVERDRLLSPYHLGARAKDLRLRSAEQGQKRLMPAPATISIRP